MDTVRSEYTEARQTPLQTFYADQTIFITGVTGLLGKVLLEKLLWSCTDICRIYLLIRPKKGITAENRLNELFENPLFDRLKTKVPNFRQKIVPIFGDLYTESLGLSNCDKTILMREVSIVFHVAATVRFNEEEHKTIILNVGGTKEILTLAQRMPKLQAFIYTSTIYSNSHMKNIDERIHMCPIDPDYLLKLSRELSKEEFSERISKIMTETHFQWPNTYAFSKFVAETLLSKASENIPLGIFRPSIIISVFNEPIAGWTDSFNGPMRLTTLIVSGILRVILCDGNLKAQIVPVDTTVNALIASAWDVSNQFMQCKGNFNRRIYNCITSDNAPNWNEFMNTVAAYSIKYPVNDTLWEPIITLTPYKRIFQIYICFYHLVPAVFIDTVRVVTGHASRMLKMYMKIHELLIEMSPYLKKNKWNWSNHNVHMMWNCLTMQDQQLFNFNMENFDWKTYIFNYCKGKRLYLLNQNDNTLQNALTKRKRFYYVHRVLKAFFWLLCFSAFWNLFLLLAT